MPAPDRPSLPSGNDATQQAIPVTKSYWLEKLTAPAKSADLRHFSTDEFSALLVCRHRKT
jgi:hypothetical protein